MSNFLYKDVKTERRILGKKASVIEYRNKHDVDIWLNAYSHKIEHLDYESFCCDNIKNVKTILKRYKIKESFLDNESIMDMQIAFMLGGEMEIYCGDCWKKCIVTNITNLSPLLVDLLLDNGAIVKDYDIFMDYAYFSQEKKEQLNVASKGTTMKNGFKISILDFDSPLNIKIRFEDGTIAEHVTYEEIQNKSVIHPKYNSIKDYVNYQQELERKASELLEKEYQSHIGEIKTMRSGLAAQIEIFTSPTDICVKFEDGIVIEHATYSDFTNGNLRNIKSRLGETKTMNNGQQAKIVEYTNAKKIAVEFEDGTILYNKKYEDFAKGTIKNPNFKFSTNNSHLYEKNTMNNGMEAEIIAWNSSLDISIRFSDGTVVEHTRYAYFTEGKIANPNFKTRNSVSYNELVCAYYLHQLGFKKAKSGCLPELGRKELDFYHPDINGYKVAIEYDGYVHKSGAGHTHKSDSEKNKLCDNAGIKLYRIREPQLPILNSSSRDYILNTRDIYSDSLQDTLCKVVNDIEKQCNCKFNIEINFTKDKEHIDEFLSQYRNIDAQKHIGETRMMNCGMEAEIVNYIGCEDVDIRFKDGTLVRHKSYSNFKKGAVANPNLKKGKLPAVTLHPLTIQEELIPIFNEENELQFQKENWESKDLTIQE